MRDTKNHERLLVAEGRPFDAPIVLARTKPYSKEYRSWKGASDDPLGPPVVQCQIVDGGRSTAMRQGSISVDRPAVENKSVLGKRRAFGGYQHHLSEGDPGTDQMAYAHLHTDPNPEILSQNALASNLNLESSVGKSRPSTTKGLEASQDPLRNPPKVALPPSAHGQALTTGNKEPDVNPGPTLRLTQDQRLLTTLNFTPYVGAQSRRRDLLTCGNYYALLRNAIAADVFPASDFVHVLSATINDQQVPITVADEVDFELLVRAIEADDCWKEVSGQCQVMIERYKLKQLIKVEH